MNINEFAEMLNGREYLDEITREEEQRARKLGFVVVFGTSDDLIEFRGAIDDEVGCYDGGEIYFENNGIFEGCPERSDCECKYLLAVRAKCKVIKAIWAKDKWSWQYETDIPHAAFEIFEDGEKYCKGIVFEMKSLDSAND